MSILYIAIACLVVVAFAILIYARKRGRNLKEDMRNLPEYVQARIKQIRADKKQQEPIVVPEGA